MLIVARQSVRALPIPVVLVFFEGIDEVFADDFSWFLLNVRFFFFFNDLNGSIRTYISLSISHSFIYLSEYSFMMSCVLWST